MSDLYSQLDEVVTHVETLADNLSIELSPPAENDAATEDAWKGPVKESFSVTFEEPAT